MIERIQRKFFCMIAFWLNISYLPHNYLLVLIALGLSSLASCKHLVNLLFLFKLPSNQIDSPSLLSKINYRVPTHNTRSFVPFHIPHFSSNFLLNAPMFFLTLQTSILLFRYLINFTVLLCNLLLFALFNIINCTMLF